MNKKKKIITESLKNQIKKYLPILKSKFSKEESADIINSIFKKDPTRDSERGEQFAGGLLKLYSNHIVNADKIEPIEKFLEYVDKYFDYFQNLNFNSYGVKKKKLNQFKDLSDFYDYILLIDKKKAEIDEGEGWKDLEGIFPIIANNKDWVIFYINDRETGVNHLGKNGLFYKTPWCTFWEDDKYWNGYEKFSSSILLFWNKKEKTNASEKLILLAMAKGICEGGKPSEQEKDMVQAFEINNLLNKRSKYATIIKNFLLKNKDIIIDKSKSENKLIPLTNNLKDFDISKNILWWLENSPKENFDKIADEFLILNKEGHSFLKEKIKNDELAKISFENKPNFEEKVFVENEWGSAIFVFYSLKNKDFFLYNFWEKTFDCLDSSLWYYQFQKDDILNQISKTKLTIEIKKLIGNDEDIEPLKKYYLLLTNMKGKIKEDFQFINIDGWFEPLFEGFSVLKKEYIKLLKDVFESNLVEDMLFDKITQRKFEDIIDRDNFLIMKADKENKIFAIGVINNFLITNSFTDSSDTYSEFASGGYHSFVNKYIKDSEEDLIIFILDKYHNLNKGKFEYDDINSLYSAYNKIFHFILIKHRLITKNKKKVEEVVNNLYFGNKENYPIPLNGSLKTEMEKHLGERFGGVDIDFKKSNSMEIKLSSATPLTNAKAKELKDVVTETTIFTYKDINNKTINISNLSIKQINFEDCGNIKIKNNNKATKDIWIKKSCSNIEIELKNDISDALFISASNVKVIGNENKIGNAVVSEAQKKVIFKNADLTGTHLWGINKECNVFFDNCKMNGIKSIKDVVVDKIKLIFRDTIINGISPFIDGEENEKYKTYFDYHKNIKVIMLDYYIKNKGLKND